MEDQQNNGSDETRSTTYEEIKDSILLDISGFVAPLDIGNEEVQPLEVEGDELDVLLDIMNNNNLEEQQPVGSQQ